MLPNPSPTEADRIALNKMFKAIAEYGRQIELTHRCVHQTLTLVLQLAKLPYLPDTDIGSLNNIRDVT
jgi:hypothetical protein